MGMGMGQGYVVLAYRRQRQYCHSTTIGGAVDVGEELGVTGDSVDVALEAVCFQVLVCILGL
jgi:hypothetical protein